ncbi:hypothetical protein DDI_0268 [Dickeya dianthicola RNS04.9]|nr:hypothetical protein DDI_0268 [Dickeya dianthicola RNS04.9]
MRDNGECPTFRDFACVFTWRHVIQASLIVSRPTRASRAASGKAENTDIKLSNANQLSHQPTQ